MEKPKFYALYKDFNNGKLEKIDVLSILWDDIFTKSGKISKKTFYTIDKITYKTLPVTSKEKLKEFIKSKLMSVYWSRCEYEIIGCDWPYKDDGLIESARPVKFDVWDQIEPNLDVIVNLVWSYIAPKLTF